MTAQANQVALASVPRGNEFAFAAEYVLYAGTVRFTGDPVRDDQILPIAK
jgi:hypothetical protein